MKQSGFFDVDERLARLSGLGDQLEAFSLNVNFEVFPSDPDKALAYSDGRKGGRPPFDPILMLKTLLIQTLNNLSGERTEYLINNRLSFMRFLGLGLSDRVPDAKTVRLFREHLTQAGAIERLFDRFEATLRNAGYLPMSGQILDATLVAATKQRNTNDEKTDLREGHQRELVKPNPWTGWNFENGQKTIRRSWTTKKLALLASASWHSTSMPEETFRQVTLIAAYSGMRLGEICTLRKEDLQTVDGVPCFLVRPHTETGWAPKTEAGSRIVPVHSKLIEAGILALKDPTIPG